MYLTVSAGVDIYYEDEGEGDPIIFVPGWTFGSEIFCHQKHYFSEHFRTVFFEPRCQGRSTTTTEGIDYDTQSADLAQLIEHLQLEKPLIVGWSSGSLTAWGLIRLLGADAFSGIVTIDLPPTPLIAPERGWSELALTDIAGFYKNVSSAERHHDWFSNYAASGELASRPLSEAEQIWLVEQSTRTPHWAAALYCASGWFRDHLPEAKLADAAIPSMIVVSDRNEAPARNFIERELPNTRLEAFGTHFMFWDQFERFNNVLGEFIGG